MLVAFNGLCRTAQRARERYINPSPKYPHIAPQPAEITLVYSLPKFLRLPLIAHLKMPNVPPYPPQTARHIFTSTVLLTWHYPPLEEEKIF